MFEGFVESLISHGSGEFGNHLSGGCIEGAVSERTCAESDGLHEMAFADTGLADENDVGTSSDELRGGELLVLDALNGLVEVPIEGVESFSLGESCGEEFLDTTALAMLCRSVLSSAEYHNRKETEIGTVSLKKGELVDFEAHLVGRSRNAAKPRVKRGRKSTLTADRMEKLLGCVRRGLSNKHACMVAGISETTFYRRIEKGKHAKRGPYREFWDSLQAAHAHFEKFHLKAIARSSLEETQSTREVIEYEGSEVVTLPDGKRQLRPGKVVNEELGKRLHSQRS